MGETQRAAPQLGPIEAAALEIFHTMAMAGCSIPETLAAIYEAGVRAGAEQASKGSPAQLVLVAPPPAPDSIPTCPYGEIVSLYHEILPTLPKVVLQSGKTWAARQRAMREIWKFIFTSRTPEGNRRATDTASGLVWIRRYFTRAGENGFLMGRGRRSDEHANWRPDFDFIVSARGMRHVMERTETEA